MSKLQQNKRSIFRMGAMVTLAAAVIFACGLAGQLLPGGGSHGQYVWAQSVAQPSVNAARAQLFPQGVKNGCFAVSNMAAGVATVMATCAAQYQQCGVEVAGLSTPLVGYVLNCGVTATATATAIPTLTSTATTAFAAGGATTTATTTAVASITSTATTAAYMQALAATANAAPTVVIYGWPF